MALSLAELETLRDALIRARASGVRAVSHNGNTVTYGSSAEMAQELADLEARIRASTASRPSTIRFSASKGV